jgi:hypothetical protein
MGYGLWVRVSVRVREGLGTVRARVGVRLNVRVSVRFMFRVRVC